jgi:hypothetical protein
MKVRTNNGIEMPSTPMWYRAPIDGIHVASVSNCMPAIPKSNLIARPITMISGNPVKRYIRKRTSRSLATAFGSAVMTRAPSSGMNTAEVSPNSVPPIRSLLG